MIISNKEQRNDSTITDKSLSWEQYRGLCDRLTDEVAHLIPGIEKRAWREWDIDHKIPLAYGFKHGIHPLKMACLSNLRVISSKENMAKGNKLIFPLSILDQHDHIQAQLQEG